MTTAFQSARRLAESTPPTRNRVVDLMRVGSILIVVFGHWLMAAVAIDDGSLVVDHVLESAAWTRPLTWVLQVMPIFFFVGGYSNALSWRSAHSRGDTYGSWLRARLRRLTLPVIPLVVVWGLFGWLALQAGLDTGLLRMASAVAIGPTWFLAAYVVIVCMAPLALKVWDRFGWWTVGAGLLAAALVDVLSIGLGVSILGFMNYVFVWGTVHQLGYAWVDGRVSGTSIRMAMVIVGLVVTLALVWAGPYPVAMVGFDTGDLSNTLPPRATLAFLGMFQAGLVLVFEKPLQRLAHRPSVWTTVVLVSAQIMTLYLWHLTAMVALIAAGLALGGFGFQTPPFTAGWWMTRPVWLAVLSSVTLVLTGVFGRFERPAPDRRPAPRPWRPVMAALMICAGLGSMAAMGIADEDGLNGLLLMLPIVGVVLGGVAGARLTDRAREQ